MKHVDVRQGNFICIAHFYKQFVSKGFTLHHNNIPCYAIILYNAIILYLLRSAMFNQTLVLLYSGKARGPVPSVEAERG